MQLTFPDQFQFGTSTSAYQIETAVDHDWCGLRSRDGFIFNRTTDHEKRYTDDIAIIASLAPNYRMSLMWSRLQRGPYAPLNETASAEYHHLLERLREKNVRIMMVLHHFANPTWFANTGGWGNPANLPVWLDYSRKVVREFGRYVDSWNTFNEPNLYTSMAWIVGEFPPFQKSLLAARKIIQNLGRAHHETYLLIKEIFPDSQVGISHNCTVFAAENFLGWLPAKILDLCFMKYAIKHFSQSDFFGMSYYARIGHDPFPITYLETPEKIKKLGKKHDDMWEYYPQGLKECIHRYWNEFRKPIIITENGICTSDDSLRETAIRDYVKIVHDALREGIDIRGYYYWSTWDNFEWSLGPTYKFGLYACDPETMERKKKPSADLYRKLAHEHILTLSGSPFSV